MPVLKLNRELYHFINYMLDVQRTGNYCIYDTEL